VETTEMTIKVLEKFIDNYGVMLNELHDAIVAAGYTTEEVDDMVSEALRRIEMRYVHQRNTNQHDIVK
jgi:hypothetical protein